VCVYAYVCMYACMCVCMGGCVCVYAYIEQSFYGCMDASYSHFHNDWFFFSKKRKYSGTQRCRKFSNRCISVTGSNVEFFFQAKKKTIILKMRVCMYIFFEIHVCMVSLYIYILVASTYMCTSVLPVCVHTYTYLCVHTNARTYIHTCVHTYLHTSIHVYIHAYVHARVHTYTYHTRVCVCIRSQIYSYIYMHACIYTNNAHLHSLIHSYLQTYVYIHTQIHTYIHTYIHTDSWNL
jgi:hypothetical protein